MPDIKISEMKWGYAFLKADARLKEEDRMHLLRESVLMYLNGNVKKDVETENIGGRITQGEYGVFGAFYGRAYNAEIDANDVRGKVKVSFLVSERTRGVSVN